MDTSYPDSVRYLYALGNEFKSIKLGLDRIQTLLAALGDPQRAFQTIHVAGTNGALWTLSQPWTQVVTGSGAGYRLVQNHQWGG